MASTPTRDFGERCSGTCGRTRRSASFRARTIWPCTEFARSIDHEWSSFEGDVLTADGRTNEARTAYTANVLAPEDIALCESVQRGLKSKGYDQGPIMAGDAPTGENEYAIHHFHKLVHEALNRYG